LPNQSLPDTPLPPGWDRSVRTAVLHVISLAHYVVVAASGWAANSTNARVRLTAENDQFKQEAQSLAQGAERLQCRSDRKFPSRRYAGNASTICSAAQ
jgi:hypothetical protein